MAGRSAIPGTSITYTNVVSDTKSSVADGGGVVDLLPAVVTSDGWTATGAGGASGSSASG